MRRAHVLRCGTALLLAVFSSLLPADGPNLVRNGDFSTLGDDGLPAHWEVRFEGDGVKGSTSMAAGPEGKAAIRIDCTAFPEKERLAWVILKQDGAVNTRKGQKLYVSFRMKKEKMATDTVKLAIMRLKPWGTLAKATLPVSEEWRKTEIIITPDGQAADCDSTRFELFFMEIGTLYVSDMHVAETSKDEMVVNPIRLRMVRETAPATEKNIIRNSSFEVGIDGWGTASFDHNVVTIDKAAAWHGNTSARIDLDRARLPAGYADYPKARKVSFTNVRCVTKGWMRFEEGKKYTLSAFLKSDRADRKANIGVFFMTRHKRTQSVSVGDTWQRHVLSFTAPDLFGFVGISSATEDSAAALWLDAVQLESGGKPSEYAARRPLELAFHTERPGGVFYAGEGVFLRLDTWFRDASVNAEVALKVADYRGNTVHQDTLSLSANSPCAGLRNPVSKNGHYTLSAQVKGDGFEYTVTTPFVIVFPYAKTYGARDARFGTNHPYYSDLLQRIAQDAGVYWVRDWTLKWDNVEPEQGRWDFSGPELFFDRARRFNLHVQAILPDPSSGWASSGPPEARGKRLGDAYEDLWHLPRSMEAYRQYAHECIKRYRDVTDVWEVLNEPFKHKCRDWRVEDAYDQFLTIVKEEAAKVDPKLQVMRCGLHYLHHAESANVRAAELAHLLSEHVYPQYNDTLRFLGHIGRINGFQKRHDVEKPIWFTEYGKYSSDHPNFRHADFAHFLANGDERTAAAYNVKYLTILFSHGVDKVFFHQRTWPLGLNLRSHRIHFDMLFDYGPAPHKFFVAANAMSWLLPPGASAGVPVNETGPIFAYSFSRPRDKVLVVWADETTVPLSAALRTLASGVAVRDMMGGSLGPLTAVGADPVYLIGDLARIAPLEKALATFGRP